MQARENASRQAQATSTGVPPELTACLNAESLNEKLVILTERNPYYLKGDFDADGRSDFAILVRGKKTHRNGVLMCMNNSKFQILGADEPISPPFSDMPNDNFVAPEWRLYSKEEAAQVHSIDGPVGQKAAIPMGDSVAMIWEDGVCVIYWDGSRYSWRCGQ
jgi:hypothetical protein